MSKSQPDYKILLYLRNVSNAELIADQLRLDFRVQLISQELPERIEADLIIVDAANLSRWQAYRENQSALEYSAPRIMLLLSRYISRQAFERIPQNTYDDAIRIPTTRSELRQRIHRLLGDASAPFEAVDHLPSDVLQSQLRHLNAKLKHAFAPSDLLKILGEALSLIIPECDVVQLALFHEKTDLNCYTMMVSTSEVDKETCAVLDAAQIYIRHHLSSQGRVLDAEEICEAIPDSLTGIITPLRYEDELLGFLIVASFSQQHYSQAEVHLLDGVAKDVAHHVMRVNQYSRSRQQAIQEERERIARELHDSVTQTLFSASMIAEAIPRQWQDAPPDVRDMLADLHHMTRGALAETRMLLIELRPGAIDHITFEDLLKHLVQGMWSYRRIAIRLTTDAEYTLSEAMKVGLYRIAQETINNALRHSKASEIHVSYYADARGIEMTIADNGVGFQVDFDHPGLGLRIMRERAQLLDAKLDITSDETGTTITVKIQSEKVAHA